MLMKDIDEKITSVWRDFEKGRMYNRMKKVYTDTEKNYDFYYGNQTKYLNIGKETPIVINIIKSIVKYKLGVINSNAYAIVYNPNFYNAEDEGKLLEELCKVLSRHSNKVWELQQVSSKIKEAVKDACINDEGILHNYFDTNKQEVCTEVIDKNNIYYGNENSSDIQSQPYIIISYRKPISQVREEATQLGIDKDKIELIVEDGETLEQAGYKTITDEVNPMCLVLLKYYKIKGEIYYTRATKSVELETREPTGMTLYPVAHIVWEEVKGSARGVGAVRNTISNQIEINKIATRRALAVKLAAFPKLVVNEDMVSNANALEKTGSTIKLKGGATIQDVLKQVGYLNATSMSPDAKNLQDDLQNNTKDLEGAGDVATGKVDPTQTSGKAILAVQQATQQPLNEQVETYKTFIEDLARIWYDMWKAYKVDGMRVMYEVEDDEGNTREVPGVFSYELLKKLDANIKVDITPQSPYDRLAQEQSIENLMMSQKITFEEYVEALPEYSIMPKFALQNILKKRQTKQKKIDEMEMQAQHMQAQFQQAMQQQDNTMNSIDNIQSEADGIQQELVNTMGGGSSELSKM
jgi:hypothetical protein|nr:MAG TPA: portal protein [Caudoviricetes sp.]